MTKFLFGALCVWLAASTALTFPNSEWLTNGRESDVIEYSDRTRLKRSLPSAIFKLIKSATMLPVEKTGANHIKYYRKRGGVKEAKQDFRDLSPTQQLDFGFVKFGKVGDRDIELNGRAIFIRDADPVPNPSEYVIIYKNN